MNLSRVIAYFAAILALSEAGIPNRKLPPEDPEPEPDPDPPANDECGPNAGTIAWNGVGGSTTVYGTTTAANWDNDIAGYCGTSVTAPGVWYTFTIPNGVGPVYAEFSTCNDDTTYDTKISIYDATDGSSPPCSFLQCVAGQDDGPCGVKTVLGTDLDEDDTYYVLIHGFGWQTGDFALTVSVHAPPDNDDCHEAFAIDTSSIDWLGAGGQSYVFGGTTSRATPEDMEIVPEVCGGAGVTERGVWYTFEVPEYISKRHVIFSTCNQAYFDMKVSVFRATEGTTGTCSDGLACIDGKDSSRGCGGGVELGVALSGGNTYFILIHGERGDTGDFDLTVTVLEPPPNDECTAAEDIAWLKKGGSTTVSGTTVGATGEDPAIVPEDCGDAGDTTIGVWYRLTVPNGKRSVVTLSTCNEATDFDTKMAVFRATDGESCSSGLECVAGEDDSDGCAGYTTVLGDLRLTRDETYYILVMGYSSPRTGLARGNFDLTVTQTPCVDFCKELAHRNSVAGLCPNAFGQCMKMCNDAGKNKKDDDTTTTSTTTSTTEEWETTTTSTTEAPFPPDEFPDELSFQADLPQDAVVHKEVPASSTRAIAWMGLVVAGLSAIASTW